MPAPRARLEICHVGRDGGFVDVLCRLAPPPIGALPGAADDIYSAEALGPDGECLDKKTFPALDGTSALVNLRVPHMVYRECAVALYAARVSDGGLRGAGLPLAGYAAPSEEELPVRFSITHPAKNGGFGPKIRVSYVTPYGDSFDYVYPGARAGRIVCLESAGSLEIPQKKPEIVSEYLSLSMGGDHHTHNGAHSVFAAGSSVIWQYAADWNAPLMRLSPEAVWFPRVKFYQGITCRIDGMIYTFLITSDREFGNAHTTHYIECIDVFVYDGESKILKNGERPPCAREEIPPEWRGDYDFAKKEGLLYGG